MAKNRKPAPIAYVGQSAVEKWEAAGVEAVTTSELARALGVTSQTVRSMPIAYTSVGKSRRHYLVADVKRHLIASTRAAS